MFTGIIEELGTVEAAAPRLRVRCSTVMEDITEGASIAVNGVCLTAVDLRPGGFAADVAPETLLRTNLGALRPGSRVNLERPMLPSGRLSGHIVQGHVDGTGTLLSRTPGDGWEAVRFGLPAELARYVAEKGSIAVDGVSLTVTRVAADWFEVGLIPETLRATVLGAKTAGDPVNLEVDVLAKYTERLLGYLAPGVEGGR